MSEEQVREALARNDRFLHQFVEAFDFCPYAKRCRETGALERRVLLQQDLSLDAPLATLDELSRSSFDHVEVGLLLFPGISQSFRDFEQFAAQLREASLRAHPEPTYYVVAFHPDAPADSDTPHRFVSFLRRSPDPTLQLVRASLLERVRGRDSEDTVWADPATLDFTKPLPPKPKSVSTKIAENNFDTLQRVGAEQLLLLLDRLRTQR